MSDASLSRAANERLRVVFCHDHPDGADFDPAPGETSRRDIKLTTNPSRSSFAAIGWRAAGLRAAELAAARPTDVSRLVLCAVPAPAGHEALAFDVAAITAKTLLLYGQADEEAPPAAAEWWKKQLVGGARVEIVPRRGYDFISEMWGRVLSHAAPGTLRQTRR